MSPSVIFIDLLLHQPEVTVLADSHRNLDPKPSISPAILVLRLKVLLQPSGTGHGWSDDVFKDWSWPHEVSAIECIGHAGATWQTSTIKGT